jgi:hypothetical protein
MRWDDIHEARETIRKQDEALRSLRDQRRERIATAALMGLLASIGGHDVDAPIEIASDALSYADALIEALDAKTEPK